MARSGGSWTALSRRDRVLGALFVLLCVVLCLRAVRKDEGVMELNRAFGARYLAGEDPYLDAAAGERVHGPYPPSFAWICAPLALLPERVARGGWALVQCLCLWILYRLLRERLARHGAVLGGSPGRARPPGGAGGADGTEGAGGAGPGLPAGSGDAPVLFALALLLASRFLLRDMAAGGGNLLYATLALLTLELALAGRPARLAGLPLGFVLAVKPNLLLLVPCLALLGRSRAALASLAWAALFFGLPALPFGVGAYGELCARWGSDVARFAALEDLHDSRLVPEGLPPARNAMNQSLRSAVQRLVRPPGDSGAPDVSLVTLQPDSAAWIARGLVLSLLVACGLAARSARDEAGRWLAGLAFLPLSLLASPITWKAHGAALLPFLFALAAQARGRRWLAVLLALFYVATNLLSEELVGKAAKEDLQALSVFTWGVLVLLGTQLVLLARRP